MGRGVPLPADQRVWGVLYKLCQRQKTILVPYRNKMPLVADFTRFQSDVCVDLLDWGLGLPHALAKLHKEN